MAGKPGLGYDRHDDDGDLEGSRVLYDLLSGGPAKLAREVYEAAKIEGASPFLTFRKITFPLMMPTTSFVFIIAVTNSFKLVDHLYIMTKGGPDNASNLLLYHIYETAFSFWDMGKASVLTVILLVILLTVSIFNYAYLDKKIHY